MLSDMLPRLAAKNFADNGLVHAELAPDTVLGLRWIRGSNISDFDFVEFSQEAKLTFRHSTLAYGVTHIVEVRSQEQVARPEARWVVAMVADVKPTTNWSLCNFIRDAMCIPLNFVGGESTVAIPMSKSWPFEAWVTIPWEFGIILNPGEFLLQKLKAGNLIAHRAALLWPWLQGRLSFTRQRPVSILVHRLTIEQRQFRYPHGGERGDGEEEAVMGDRDELEQIRDEQRRALAMLLAGHPEQRWLRLALNDWFAEEMLMLREAGR